MRFYSSISLALMLGSLLSCSHAPAKLAGDPKLKSEGETHLDNIRQLTHGGTDTGAYWSFSGHKLVFAHKGLVAGAAGPECDQIYTMKTDGSDFKMLSNGKGLAAHPLFLPKDERLSFSSTFATDEKCPAPPDLSQGYVWPIYSSFQMYIVKPDGSDPLPFEPGEPRAYNAEAAVCKDGSVVFTSDRDGDLELYRGKLDRFNELSEVTRITHSVGYDGGAFFSPDCSKIAWRASRPQGPEADEYKRLLKQHLVHPTDMEIWVAASDGTHAHQVTHLGVASSTPSFTPDGQRIIFASNPRDPHGRKSDLYLIRADGTGLERVTYSDTFESTPVFSPDGKSLAFISNRGSSDPRENHVFLADWVDAPALVSPALPESPADRYMSQIIKLTAPEMEGRAPGTLGLAKAEDFVIAQFATLGLKPFPPREETFKQKIDMTLGKDKHIVSANNVVGAWGKGCGKVAPIVIGAHLDHLGNGGPGSLDATQLGLHPGADDNASGVVSMLEAARQIVWSAQDMRACFVFAAFTGEEFGIAGSIQFAALLKKRRIKPKAMINLDMVGRMEGNHLIAFGTDTALEWRGILNEKCSAEHLLCDGVSETYGPGDRQAFYDAHVPVLQLFTGQHADYHRISDTAEKINATGGIQAAAVVAAVALQIATPQQKLHYQKIIVPLPPAADKPQSKSANRRSGAYLGAIPDYAAHGSEPQSGVHLTGTRAGSPAEKAGIKEGDILFAIGTKPVSSLEDYMNILASLKAGDEVILHVKRKTVDMALPAKVGNRE